MIENCVVYQIINKNTFECLYVGSTKNFTRRKWKHKHNCYIDTSKKIYNKIRDIGGIDNVNINIIQAFRNIEKVELLKKERYYCDLLKPECNMRKAYRSPEEIVEDKRRWKREYWARRGHITNAKKREKVKCNICNIEINRGCLARHYRSQRHLNKVQIDNALP